ncbi:hypothetical protein B0B52_19350 [Polaromonas sp. A23]|nr:hypothetical protein B0B52_19350 [Polaromonas sp. A23]
MRSVAKPGRALPVAVGPRSDPAKGSIGAAALYSFAHGRFAAPPGCILRLAHDLFDSQRILHK